MFQRDWPGGSSHFTIPNVNTATGDEDVVLRTAYLVLPHVLLPKFFYVTSLLYIANILSCFRLASI